jgi:hypothetical protein
MPITGPGIGSVQSRGQSLRRSSWKIEEQGQGGDHGDLLGRDERSLLDT